MRILIITQYFWPENFRINDLTAALLERGHQVTVLTGIPNYPEGRFFNGYGLFKNLRQNYHGAQIIRVPLVPRGNGSGLRLGLNYLSFAVFSSLLAPFLCKEDYDVIFVFEPSPITVGLPALVLKKLSAIPILFWVQDLWPESLSATGAVQSEFILNMVRRIVGFIYHGCDKILVTSKAYIPSIKDFGVDERRLHYFPQSVETLYRPIGSDSDASESRLLPNGFRVMFAGNIGAAQAFETILDAAENLREHDDIHWIIVGDGRKRHWVESEVKRRALSRNVHLVGRYPVEAMPQFFSLADVMLVTLKKEPIFSLTVPAKIQSYLACGKAIIAALDGEGNDLIREAKAGLCCPAEDSDALAEAVLKMSLLSKAEIEEMGRCGLHYYEANFEREMLTNRLEGWMRDVCNKL